MRPARRRRLFEAVALSVVAHAAILIALALHAPLLKIPPPERGPPIAVIPILLLPKTPPPSAAAGPKPSPIRLHQRSQRPAPPDTPVKPLIVPSAEPARAPPAPTPKVIVAPPPSPIAANATRALRGLVGCANPERLTRDERQACEDRLATGARGAAYLGTGIEAGKATGLAAEALRAEQDYGYKRSPRLSAPAQRQLPWDTGRGPPGQAETLGAQLGNDRPKTGMPF